MNSLTLPLPLLPGQESRRAGGQGAGEQEGRREEGRGQEDPSQPWEVFILPSHWEQMETPASWLWSPRMNRVVGEGGFRTEGGDAPTHPAVRVSRTWPLPSYNI